MRVEKVNLIPRAFTKAEWTLLRAAADEKGVKIDAKNRDTARSLDTLGLAKLNKRKTNLTLRPAGQFVLRKLEGAAGE